MGRNWRAAGWAAGLVFCFATSEAFADIEVLSVEDSNSWITNLRVVGPTSFTWDRIMFTTLAIGTSVTFLDNSTGTVDCEFEVPGGVITNMLQAGWTQNVSPTTTFTQAANLGNPGNTLQFKLHWENPSNPGATTGIGGFNIYLFNGTTLVGTGTRAIKKFGSSAFIASEGSVTAAVPVPAAVWTGLPVLAGMMLLLRRRKRRMLV